MRHPALEGASVGMDLRKPRQFDVRPRPVNAIEGRVREGARTRSPGTDHSADSRDGPDLLPPPGTRDQRFTSSERGDVGDADRPPPPRSRQRTRIAMAVNVISRSSSRREL
jgi:hypothetical protein